MRYFVAQLDEPEGEERTPAVFRTVLNPDSADGLWPAENEQDAIRAAGEGRPTALYAASDPDAWVVAKHPPDNADNASQN